jgi:uncharacterized membrane protein YdjX (TVP38/TMEM64 family)
MKTFYRKMMIAGAFLFIAFLLLYYFGIARNLSIENIKAMAVGMQQQVQEHYLKTALIFISISTVLIALTLPVTGPMGIVGGFIFGLWLGLLYCMIAILIGTLISFLVIRYALSHIVRSQYQEKLDEFTDRVHKYGYSYLISLQLLTVVPFFVINTLAALAGVNLSTFLATTMIGATPVMFIYTFAGRELCMIQSWKDILSIHTVLLLGVLSIIAMMPMIVRKLRSLRFFKPKDPMDDDSNISPWLDN